MINLLRRFAILPIRFYKYCISPMLPPACRYVPTCSEYAMVAIERHGIVRGGLYALWRILRCNPLVRGGYDPVPPAKGNASPSEAGTRPGTGNSPDRAARHAACCGGWPRTHSHCCSNRTEP